MSKSTRGTLQGPRGSLSKSFRHLAVDIFMVDKETVKVEKWFGKRKELAAVRTVCSHITNLCNGVTKVSVSDVTIGNNSAEVKSQYDALSQLVKGMMTVVVRMTTDCKI